MSLMGNGGLVITIMKTKSKINEDFSYIHKPNGVLRFINNYCKINGMYVEIPPSEQKFLNDVWDDNVRIPLRHKGRRTGGSTLLGLIAYFHVLNGKKVGFISNIGVMYNILNTLQQIELNDGYITPQPVIGNGTSRGYINLVFNNKAPLGKIEICQTKNYETMYGFVRGRHFDYILSDMQFKSERELEEFKAHMNHSIKEKTGKLIINVTV